ncbi:unnamed protein product [Arctia plantaginis]|uniref:Uncharacterized protein n=1 Tax=Arctia plantaginis TaxID=874455 RepID=A0A8S1B7N6_ARCPL|nr:unnamed protein product [Arctia plantaginis]
MVFSLKNVSYQERLLELNLPTLEQRRMRGDLIETYKILNHHYNVRDIESMFTMNPNTQLRGHSMKLSKHLCTSNPRKYFLPNRVVHMWNSLPETVIGAKSINIFKNRLDKHLNAQV